MWRQCCLSSTDAQRIFLYSYSLFMFMFILYILYLFINWCLPLPRGFFYIHILYSCLYLYFISYIHSSTDVCRCPEAWVKPIPSVGRDRKWTFPKTFQILTKRIWKEALHAQGFQIAKENFGLQVAWIIFLTKDIFERCYYGNIGINEMNKNLNNKGKNTPLD